MSQAFPYIKQLLQHDFTGRVAIVTGAASGFGEVVARTLAAGGASVTAVDISPNVRQLAAEIGQSGVPAHGIVADLSKANEVGPIIAETIKRYGRIDLMVNNAGIWLPSAFEDTTTQNLDLQMMVNFRSHYMLTQRAVKHMRSGSSIVFVSSPVGGQVGFPNSSAYAASKGAIWGAVRALGVELAPKGIRVNGVAPGNVENRINRHALQRAAHRDFVISRTPMGRLGQSHEIAAAIIWLLSEASSFVVGETITADGGFVAM